MSTRPHVNIHSRQQMIQEVTPSGQDCLISIQSATGRDYDDDLSLLGWKDVLSLSFDDESYGIPFNAHMAQETLAFIQRNLGQDFVVHCDAGISRSVAIGKFMRDFFRYRLRMHAYGKLDRSNLEVYSILGSSYHVFFRSDPWIKAKPAVEIELEPSTDEELDRLGL